MDKQKNSPMIDNAVIFIPPQYFQVLRLKFALFQFITDNDDDKRFDICWCINPRIIQITLPLNDRFFEFMI